MPRARELPPYQDVERIPAADGGGGASSQRQTGEAVRTSKKTFGTNKDVRISGVGNQKAAYVGILEPDASLGSLLRSAGARGSEAP